MRSVHLKKIVNKFLAPLLGKVRFGVWIDILAKEKFANLSKNFLFIFSFSFLFEFCILQFSFIMYFFLLGAKYNVGRGDE